VISNISHDDLDKLQIILNRDSEMFDEYGEKRESGSVKFSVYLTYLQVGIKFLGPIVLVSLFLLVQFLVSYGDYWLSYW
jgi:hypothetical protein